MRAIVQDAYGTADTWRFTDSAERPVPGDDEVLVRVRAAGMDAGVWHLMTGTPYLIRLLGYGLRRPKRRVPGMDLAGTVEAVGAHVTRLRPGDEVFGMGRGAYAEYACAPQGKLAPKPPSLSFEQAAAVPVSGLTALQALRDLGQLHAGQRVLVIGASGGVGSYAVQLAKAYGAEVTGVCGSEKADLVRSLGADHVVDYTRTDVTDVGGLTDGGPADVGPTRGGGGFDLVLDIAGGRPVSRLRRTLAPGGTLVLVGNEHGSRWAGGMGRVLGAALLSPFLGRRRVRPMATAERYEDLLVLAEFIEAGKLTPALDRTYPLAEAAEAVRSLARRRVRGKSVLSV
ncbi:NAD(P)-dependent alcohol dehydrogenase [Streptomyces sp. G-G2]|uniref:NAD(P)-dependent alcohol dehydrogenase n=1 Tax=Streptomyces sp. G-G2 TaxID=3046201 RepID=UPI0024B9DFBF|nr:NAD(P)-dependent alcohol dehydrogenase [Streptomyces sp. G-G2]MDJ0380077.1 NAD(P)-dependent alcohol dehydrogenase [Streptomyces sp. G-G2]